MSEIRGVLTAMVTPFSENGAIDLDATRRLARKLVDEGCHGLVVTGTTGEASTISDDEKVRLFDAVLDAVGSDATVIAGTGSNDTAHTTALTHKAVDVGVHAVLIVTPYYNKPNEAGLRAHYAAVSDAAAQTPIILYNIPSRCGINIGPELLASLAADHANIVAVKQANNDELGPIEGLEILAGNDEVFLRTLEFGGAGGILVASNVAPGRMRSVYDAATAGDLDAARAVNDEMAPLYRALTVVPPAVAAKTALELLGVIPATVRLPMVAPSDAERDEIRATLSQLGLAGSGAVTS
jgi:4-hydroxy-tetrahydrodipicolinate synthase